MQATDSEFLPHLTFLFVDQLSLHIIFRTLKMAATESQHPKQKQKGNFSSEHSLFTWIQALILGQKCMKIYPKTCEHEELSQKKQKKKG